MEGVSEIRKQTLQSDFQVKYFFFFDSSGATCNWVGNNRVTAPDLTAGRHHLMPDVFICIALGNGKEAWGDSCHNPDNEEEALARDRANSCSITILRFPKKTSGKSVQASSTF